MSARVSAAAVAPPQAKAVWCRDRDGGGGYLGVRPPTAEARAALLSPPPAGEAERTAAVIDATLCRRDGTDFPDAEVGPLVASLDSRSVASLYRHGCLAADVPYAAAMTADQWAAERQRVRDRFAKPSLSRTPTP